MNEKSLIQLYKKIEQRAQTDRPTYLTNFQRYGSVILNKRDDRFFNRKQYRIASEKEYVRDLYKNRYVLEEILNFWHLTNIFYNTKYGTLGKIRKLTPPEIRRYTSLINWILHGQLTKHRDRIKHVMQKEFTGKVDVSKISNELLQVNLEADKKILTELETINNRINAGMSDDLILRKVLQLEYKYWGYFTDCDGFRERYLDYITKVAELLGRQIFFGYKDAIKDHIEFGYLLPVLCRQIFEDYLFTLGLDAAFMSSKIFNRRAEKLNKLYEKMLKDVVTFFEDETSEDIGPIDVTLVMAPIITFKKNLDLQIQQYKKKYKLHLNYSSKIRRGYERFWIRELYKNIREDCAAQNITVKNDLIEILYSVMVHIGKVFDEFHKTCKTNFTRSQYTVDNLRKMIREI